MMRLPLSLAAALTVASIGLAQAQVTPDGGTATTVVVDGGGRFLVDIAPVAGSGISRNTYEVIAHPLARPSDEVPARP